MSGQHIQDFIEALFGDSTRDLKRELKAKRKALRKVLKRDKLQAKHIRRVESLSKSVTRLAQELREAQQQEHYLNNLLTGDVDMDVIINGTVVDTMRLPIEDAIDLVLAQDEIGKQFAGCGKSSGCFTTKVRKGFPVGGPTISVKNPEDIKSLSEICGCPPKRIEATVSGFFQDDPLSDSDLSRLEFRVKQHFAEPQYNGGVVEATAVLESSVDKGVQHLHPLSYSDNEELHEKVVRILGVYSGLFDYCTVRAGNPIAGYDDRVKPIKFTRVDGQLYKEV